MNNKNLELETVGGSKMYCGTNKHSWQETIETQWQKSVMQQSST